tara:strand:- start:196 stop:435 length:240 start_codon:yes stop_codon:yes gene_type:complete
VVQVQFLVQLQALGVVEVQMVILAKLLLQMVVQEVEQLDILQQQEQEIHHPYHLLKVIMVELVMRQLIMKDLEAVEQPQ